MFIDPQDESPAHQAKELDAEHRQNIRIQFLHSLRTHTLQFR